jgi:RNA polymerase sigma factor (sigma-70 family)
LKATKPVAKPDPNFWLPSLRKQDRKAQHALFQYFHKRMFSLCHRYIPDPYQAEDVMMAAFLQFFTQIDRFEERGSLEGWLRRIAVSQCLQFLRKSRSMEVLRFEDVEEFDPVETSLLPQDLDYEILLGLVQKLPMGYRMVFNLFAVEGYSHAEIADELGISEGTSRSQLAKARALLQSWISQLEQPTSQSR